jgi:hypothetical protein
MTEAIVVIVLLIILMLIAARSLDRDGEWHEVETDTTWEEE